MVINLDSEYRQYFPELANQYSLKEFQKSVIQNVLYGNNTLCIMPTGGGKSLIYWLSGLMLKGITIVISPLIALIDEQAAKIREHGYEVLTIHGGMNWKMQIDLLRKLHNRELNPDFIFVSPERISIDGFFEYCIRARKDEIKLIAIDEVHCVSQWGVSFRPFYQRIPVFLDQVFEGDWPKILGLTATLNPKEVVNICDSFHISKQNILKDDLLIRTEIELKVLKFTTEEEKEEKLWQLLKIHRNEKVLVYLYRKFRKRGTEDLRDKAIERGFRANNFHGEMSAKERQEIIQSFKNGELDVIFATNAFGMGVDIPDIRVVIHFMIPESVEQYYQEVGRAARDGQPSNAYILFSNKNIQVKKTHFIDNSFPTSEELQKSFKKITRNKLGLNTLEYFEEDEEIQQCLPYFLDHGLLTIRSKGFTNLNIFSKIDSDPLTKLYNCTKTKGTIRTIKESGMEPDAISRIVYSSVVEGKAKLSKNFDKCLIVENNYEEIPEAILNEIIAGIEEKKTYKHGLLDYFTYLIDGCESSKELHQEIGLYLGVDKHKVGRIYKTRKGDLVRSKSEVIIANLLFEENINYEYERKLFYDTGKWIEPDFTIFINDKEIYWEHLGMIGTESYDNRWQTKLDIYETFFPNSLVKTYEGATLTNAALTVINFLKAGV